MVKLIVFFVLLDVGGGSIYVTVATEHIKALEGALFNEYDWEYDFYIIEARRRGGKRDKGRKRGGNGLR